MTGWWLYNDSPEGVPSLSAVRPQPSVNMMTSSRILLLLVSLTCQMRSVASADRPHILRITVNNLGWADVGWRDTSFVTPHLNRLVSEGVNLINYYVPPNGVTSRIAVATGRYPFTMGFKTFGSKYSRKSNFSLSLDYKLLSSYMKDEGYTTYLVGTWNLGFCSDEYTPLRRGYDFFYGSFNAQNGHYCHESIKHGGYDFRNNTSVDWSAKGKYSVTLFSDYVVNLIEGYGRDGRQDPLFITLAHDVINKPLQAPSEFVKQCEHIKETMRRLRCAMMAAVDHGVGRIMDAFRRNGEDANLLLFFSAVNGGTANYASSNHPLRGFKHTLYDGGSRVNAFMYSPSLLPAPYTFSGLMHAIDVLPTLMAASKADPSRIPGNVNGRSLWDNIVNKKDSRRRLLIYDVDVPAGLGAFRGNNWKLIYNKTCAGDSKSWELYWISSDRSETNDLSATEPAILKGVKLSYKSLEKSAVPHQTYVVKPESDPDKHGGVWAPFGC